MNNSSSEPTSISPPVQEVFGRREASESSAMSCNVRAYAEINEYLPQELRFHSFLHSCTVGSSVGTIVGELGIPAGEIDLILLNGVSRDLTYPVCDGDRLSLYPVFESFDISSVTKVRQKPLRTIRFVLDVHLGKLAYYLRMLGFDTKYRNDFEDEDLVRESVDEKRTLLSKDRKLLGDERIQRCHFVREKHPRQQLVEVLKRFDLFASCVPLQRCIRCNVILESVEKSVIVNSLPPLVVGVFQEFRQCPSCRRVYWNGSHYDRMMTFIDGIMRHRTNSFTETNVP